MPKYADIGPATRRVLDYFRTYIEQQGQCPTLAEAHEALEISRTSVATHILRLQANGYVRRTPNVARNVRLTKKAYSKLA